jgi:hypothetical protein
MSLAHHFDNGQTHHLWDANGTGVSSGGYNARVDLLDRALSALEPTPNRVGPLPSRFRIGLAVLRGRLWPVARPQPGDSFPIASAVL